MGNVIITRLNPNCPFKIGSKSFYFDLELDSDVSKKSREKLLNLIQNWIQDLMSKQPTLNPKEVVFLATQGAVDAKGQPIAGSAKSQNCLKEMQKLLDRGKVHIPLPDPKQLDQAESPIQKQGRAKATFSFSDEPHYLDKISYARRPRRPNESREQWVRRCAQELGKEKYDPKKKKTQETLIGVSQSLIPRKNYQMQIALQKEMRSFFQRDGFTSIEVFAKNGYIDGAITASFNRYADRPTLLRAVEAEDGSVDVVSGRAFDLASAEEVASFAFLSQMKLYKGAQRSLAQGISKQGEEYHFEFSIHSLLPVASGFMPEEQMVRKEIKAYQQLQAKGPIQIKDPENPSVVYTVHMHPLPITACQFNYWSHVEKMVSSFFSGEYRAWKLSEQADQILIQRAHAAARECQDSEQRKKILDTAYFLEQERAANPLTHFGPRLKAWQLLMVRAYLCLLLKIPVINHCKSCVDRTNVENAMISAMNQWIRSGRKIPELNGKIAIFSLATQIASQKGKKFFPFKELVAYNLHKGLKITELARGKKGYKFGRGIGQHPALSDLLPKRYLQIKKISFAQRWVLPICLLIFPLFLMQLAAWTALSIQSARVKTAEEKKGILKKREQVFLLQKTLWKKGVLGKIASVFSPVVTSLMLYLYALIGGYKFLNNAHLLFPKKQVKETYREVGKYPLLYGDVEYSGKLLEDSDS